MTFSEPVDESLLHAPVSEPSKHIYFKDLKLLANEEASSGRARGAAGSSV